MNTYYDEYLTHHGVKGMKWGVRKEKEPQNNKPLKERTKYSYAAKGGIRALKTVGQTIGAYLAPSVAAGLFVGGVIGLNPAMTIAGAQGLFTSSAVVGLTTGIAGAGVSVVANGAKFVKDMLEVKANRESRYQTSDGKLTAEGKDKFLTKDGKLNDAGKEYQKSLAAKARKGSINKQSKYSSKASALDLYDENYRQKAIKNSKEYVKKLESQNKPQNKETIEFVNKQIKMYENWNS